MLKYSCFAIILIFLTDFFEFPTTKGTVNYGFPIYHGKFFNFFFSNKKICSCKCGVPNRRERLLGGEYLKGHEFPWLVLIHIRSHLSVGGVLINDRYVLTSAGPLIGVTPYEVKINLGVYDRCALDISSANVSAKHILIHPDFNENERTHDIALIHLTNTVVFDRRIHPICLPTPDTSYVGQVGTVAAWTQPSKNAELKNSDHLSACRPKKLGLPILGEECSNLLSKTEKESRNIKLNRLRQQGCLGIVGASSVVCKTDTGNPVQFRSIGGTYELIGILSDVNECSQSPSMARFTRVNYHLPWITRQTADACYCQKMY